MQTDLRANGRQVSPQNGNASHILFSSFSNSDDIFRKVCGVTQDRSGEQWDPPSFNRFLTRDWRDMKESEKFIKVGSDRKESIPGILGGAPP